MTIGVRTPSETVFVAELRDLDRTLHRPEVRVGERDVDRLQFQRVVELAPVGGDHVRGGAEAGGFFEFRHNFAAGEAGFGAAGVFGIGEDAFQVLADLNGFLEQPSAVGVEREASGWYAGGEPADGLDLESRAEHAALQLKVLETEAFLHGLGLPDDAFGSQCLFVAEAVPSVLRVGFLAIAEGVLRRSAMKKR